MRRATGKLTYANVMATIAVFIALGGGAYAALKLPKNSVGTKQLKREAVTGAKVKKDTLTGQEIKLSSLGQVPSAASATTAASAGTADRAATAGNADTLGGLPAAAFAQAGRFVSGSASTVPTSRQPILTVPGTFRVMTEGGGLDAFYPRYENLSSSQIWRFIQPNGTFTTVGPSETSADMIVEPQVGLILAQNVTDPAKFVILLCGYSTKEKEISCQATIPPGV
jgi:hypothetical protein